MTKYVFGSDYITAHNNTQAIGSYYRENTLHGPSLCLFLLSTLNLRPMTTSLLGTRISSWRKTALSGLVSPCQANNLQVNNTVQGFVAVSMPHSCEFFIIQIIKTYKTGNSDIDVTQRVGNKFQTPSGSSIFLEVIRNVSYI